MLNQLAQLTKLARELVRDNKQLTAKVARLEGAKAKAKPAAKAGKKADSDFLL